MDGVGGDHNAGAETAGRSSSIGSGLDDVKGIGASATVTRVLLLRDADLRRPMHTIRIIAAATPAATDP
ncbi:MAG: hypothetical protein M3011_05255 [Actinomycetota bacterium]|nr:hypothetical protein [Actinomycetota bacterium]